MRFSATGDISLGSGISLNNSSGRPILKQTGSILQVVSAFRSPTSSTSTTTQGTWVNTNTQATITPSSTSSRILILISESMYFNNSGGSYPNMYGNVQRAISGGSTTNAIGASGEFYFDNRGAGTLFGQQMVPCHISYVDSPSTTSAITYTFQIQGSSGSAGTNFSNADFSSGVNGTGYITLLEIAG